MTIRAKLALGLGAAALLAVSATPAAAGRYDRHWGHRDRGGSGFGAGAVLGAILGVGVVAAIASSSAKKREAEERRARGDLPRDERPYDQDDRGYDGRAGTSAPDDGRAFAEDMAVDACAIAARDEASRSGGFVDIREITEVRPYGEGYDVTGTVDQRASYSARDNRQRSFRCTFERGAVSRVMFGTAV